MRVTPSVVCRYSSNHPCAAFKYELLAIAVA